MALAAAHAPRDRRHRHRRRLLLLAALAAAALAFWVGSAAGQTRRGMEIIDRTLALMPQASAGAALYREACASCHGSGAQGNAAQIVPALAGQLQHYLIKQLADFAEGDRASADMHRVMAAKRLTSLQSIRNVAAYLSELPPVGRPELGDGKQLAVGRRVYERLCIECHGRNAQGDARYAVPSLRRQHYSYLLSQIRTLAVGHRYSVDIGVVNALERLSYDELTAVADYLARLPAAASQSAKVHTPSEPAAGSSAYRHDRPACVASPDSDSDIGQARALVSANAGSAVRPGLSAAGACPAIAAGTVFGGRDRVVDRTARPYRQGTRDGAAARIGSDRDLAQR